MGKLFNSHSMKIYDGMIDSEVSKIRSSKFPDIAILLHTPILVLLLPPL